MTSINSGYNQAYRFESESKPKDPVQTHNPKPLVSSTTAHNSVPSGTHLVSRGYLKGERVNDNSLLGKLRQKLGQPNQLAVHRSNGSGALFATGVSQARFAKLKRPADNEARANLVAAERILKAAKIDIPGMTATQKMRLAVIAAQEPGQAFEVANRAHGDTKDLNVLLNTAEQKGLDTTPTAALVQSKRDELTKPKSSGGLGINPQNLFVKRELGCGFFGVVNLYEDPESKRLFAGKILNNNGGLQAATLEQEEAMLARLPQHQNLVKSFGIHNIDGRQVLLQEFVPGDNLESIFANPKWKNLSADEKQLVFKHVATEMFRGLAELQKLGIAHEDVRAANLLFDRETLGIKLADFGIARDRGHENVQLRPFAWAPPETLAKPSRRASHGEDMFSASRVLVGELVPHTNLFNKRVHNDTVYGLKDQLSMLASLAREGTPSAELHQDTRDVLKQFDESGKMAAFFAAISHPDPTQRLRADQALMHEFLADPVPLEDLRKVLDPLISETPATTQQVDATSNSTSVPQSANPQVSPDDNNDNNNSPSPYIHSHV